MADIAESIRERLDRLRHAVWARLGQFPQRCDLGVEMLETIEVRGIIREKIRYQVERDEWIEAYVGRPINTTGRLPAIVAVHSHGGNRFYGKGEIFDTIGPANRRGGFGWGYELVQRGYVVIAADQLGKEDRRWRDLVDSADASHEDFEALSRLAQGSSYFAKLAFDSMRAVDVLQTRADVDPGRIGAIGTSGGGMQTYTLAIVDARVTAAVMSCGFGSVAGAIRGAGGPSGIGVFPNWMDLGDMAAGIAMIAPRAALISNGSEDVLFATDGILNTYHRGKQAFEQLGCPQRCELDLFPGKHMFADWQRPAFYDFFDRYLKRQPISPDEIWYRHDDPIPRQSQAQVRIAVEPYLGKPVNLQPTLLSQMQLREGVLEQIRLTVDAPVGNPVRCAQLEPYDQPNDHMRGIRSWVEDCPWLDVSVVAPASAEKSKQPATIILHRSADPMLVGRDEPLGFSGDSRFALGPELLRRNHVVAAIDLPAHGQRFNSRIQRRWPGSRRMQLSFAQIFYLKAGTDLMARGLHDVRCLTDYLLTRDDVDPRRIAVVGYGVSGLIALMAAVRDPRLIAAACIGGVSTVRAAIDGRVWNSPWLYRPDILLRGDVSEVVCAIQPRPLYLEAFEGDANAPIAGFNAVASALKNHFEQACRGADLQIVRRPGTLNDQPPACSSLGDWLERAGRA